MPLVVAFKFSNEELPQYFLPGPLEDSELKIQEFCVAPREDTEDVGFVAALEHWSHYQVHPERQLPALIRRATQGEIDRWWEVKALERRALLTCKQKVAEHALPMKVSAVRYEERNNKLAFQFTSDKRVDFRALVRDLAATLRSRIELWQIGVREEARIQDGYGVCGLRTCCSAWIRDFRPVTLKMAKEQDIDLPPSKLTGQCGRLLCCLSYEVDAYRELSREALPRGTTVVYRAGRGVVVDRNLIRKSYVVSDEQGTLSTVVAADIREYQLPEQMKHMGKAILAGFMKDAQERARPTTPDTESDVTIPEDDAQEPMVASTSTDPVYAVSPEDAEEVTEPPSGQRQVPGKPSESHPPSSVPPKPRPPMHSPRKEGLAERRDRREGVGPGYEKPRPPRFRRRGRGRRGGRPQGPGGPGSSGPPQGGPRNP